MSFDMVIRNQYLQQSPIIKSLASITAYHLAISCLKDHISLFENTDAVEDTSVM